MGSLLLSATVQTQKRRYRSKARLERDSFPWRVSLKRVRQLSSIMTTTPGPVCHLEDADDQTRSRVATANVQSAVRHIDIGYMGWLWPKIEGKSMYRLLVRPFYRRWPCG